MATGSDPLGILAALTAAVTGEHPVRTQRVRYARLTPAEQAKLEKRFGRHACVRRGAGGYRFPNGDTTSSAAGVRDYIGDLPA